MHRPRTAAVLILMILVGSSSAQQAPPEVFRALDVNNDGRITNKEVPEAQRPYFERVLRIGDQNGDGAITSEEFAAALRPEPPPAPANGFGSFQQGPPRGRFGGGVINGGLVDRFDQNNDGKLALNEVPQPLQQALHPVFERSGKDELTREELTRFAARQLTGFLERLDTNDDGKIALSELPEGMQQILKPIFDRADAEELPIERLQALMAARGRPPQSDSRRPGEPQNPAMDVDRLFRQRDANSDGFLSRDEAQLQGAFDRLDRNSDGKLSKEELQRGRPQRPRPPQ